MAGIVAVVDFHDYNRVAGKTEVAVKNQPYYRMVVRAVVVCSFEAELLGFALISRFINLTFNFHTNFKQDKN